jgi:hypothetical protein
MDVLKVEMAVFKSEWPMAAGYYWSAEEYQLLRGPFTTKEEAETDAQRIGRNLLSVILDAADQDDNQRRANKLM